MAFLLFQGGRGGDDISADSSGRGIDEAPLIVTTGPAPIPAIRLPIKPTQTLSPTDFADPWTAQRLISILFVCQITNIPCAWSGQATWARARLDTAPIRATMMSGEAPPTCR